MSNDLRYVSKREKQRASMYGVTYRGFVDPHETILGRWIASKPSIFKIDNILFSHGGVIANYGDFSAKTFNDSVAMFMQEPVFTHLMDEEIDSTVLSKDRWLYLQDFFNDPYNPYWFRGYALSDTLSSYLDLIHQKFGTKIHVVCHTPFPTITEKYNGKLIATNVEKFGTEMLLLVRKGKRNYRRYRIDIEGNIEGL